MSQATLGSRWGQLRTRSGPLLFKDRTQKVPSLWASLHRWRSFCVTRCGWLSGADGCIRRLLRSLFSGEELQKDSYKASGLSRLGGTNPSQLQHARSGGFIRLLPWGEYHFQSSSWQVSCWIGKAATTFNRLRNRSWSNRLLTEHTKVNIYKACVLSVVLYGSEAWPSYMHQEKRLHASHVRCLRNILDVTW